VFTVEKPDDSLIPLPKWRTGALRKGAAAPPRGKTRDRSMGRGPTCTDSGAEPSQSRASETFPHLICSTAIAGWCRGSARKGAGSCCPLRHPMFRGTTGDSLQPTRGHRRSVSCHGGTGLCQKNARNSCLKRVTDWEPEGEWRGMVEEEPGLRNVSTQRHCPSEEGERSHIEVQGGVHITRWVSVLRLVVQTDSHRAVPLAQGVRTRIGRCTARPSTMCATEPHRPPRGIDGRFLRPAEGPSTDGSLTPNDNGLKRLAPI
jgi:hypothetical protein